MSDKKAILGYWAIRGLGNPIRYLLEFTEIPYEDKRYACGPAPDFDRSDWTEAKETLGLDFPNLPYFIQGDLKLTESRAILKHIGRMKNLNGSTNSQKATVDMLLNVLGDFSSSITRICYNPNYEELLKAHTEKTLPMWLGRFEKFLGDKTFIAGETVTVADFPLFELLSQSLLMVPDCLKSYPKLNALVDRINALPQIAAYKKSDRHIERPCNNLNAGFK